MKRITSLVVSVLLGLAACSPPPGGAPVESSPATEEAVQSDAPSEQPSAAPSAAPSGTYGEGEYEY